MPDLITLSQVRAYGGTAIDQTTAGALIPQVSRAILTNLQRSSLLPVSYADVFNGHGRCNVVLSAYPVVSVSSVVVDGVVIPAATPNAPGVAPGVGWLLEDQPDPPPGRQQSVWLRGYEFRRGIQNCTVSYNAGYQITAEPHTIPGSSAYVVKAVAPFGEWALDLGVSLVGGAALIAVPASSTPSAGQYSVAAGVYTFAAADAGKAILLSYGYVPSDIAYAACMWVAESVSYTGRIGMQSKSVGGQETVSYMVSPMPKQVDLLLSSYRKVVML